MEKDLSDYRKSYEKKELIEDSVPANPIELFQQWFDEVESGSIVDEPNAMTLSTVDEDGFPKGRVVLLKRFSEAGFIFYTNYESEKGKAIDYNPNVSLSFFWPKQERQVIIKGIAKKVAENLSDQYFAKRPRKSQLGAVVSNQSKIIESRTQLENDLHQLEEKYENKNIDRPKNWGGYTVSAISIEFWQGRRNRLHDRIRYTQLEENANWKIERLAP